MRFYTTEQLSPKISETPEGFLVCENVPIARTGEQIYRDSEVPVTAKNGIVRIMRDEDEVFNEFTIKSFEGKPVTLDHPQDFVTPENWQSLTHGTVQNVRRGTGEQDDLLLADLLITTEKAIELVKAGLREVSCGYDAEYEETEEGLGRQIKIIGNHLAIVDKGRAGSRCSIGDKACDHCGQCTGNCKNKDKHIIVEDSQMKMKDKIKKAFNKVLDSLEDEELLEKKEDKKDEVVADKKSVGKGRFIMDKKAGKGKGFFIKDDGEEIPATVEDLKEKAEELTAIIAQMETPAGETAVVTEEQKAADEGDPFSEIPKEKTEEDIPSSIKDPVVAGEEEGATGSIEERLAKLEEVIAELVKSDEEVHSAMDAIMKATDEDEETPEAKAEKAAEFAEMKNREKSEAEVKDEGVPDLNKAELAEGLTVDAGECSICGKNPSTGSVGHWYTCNDPKCKEKAEEMLKEDKDEDEESGKKETNDSWNDISYRVGILAPEINIAKPTKNHKQLLEVIKREALKKAFTTDSACVLPFIKGKNINTITGPTLDAVFIGASELIAKVNNSRVQRPAVKMYDAGTMVANDVRAINDKNKNFWKR